MFHGEELEFPVTFTLRVIMVRDVDDERTRQSLENVLLRTNTRFTDWEKKAKPESRYIRFRVSVTLESREKMYALYDELQKEPAVKTAI